MAADSGLLSNFAFGVFPAGSGAVWVGARGDAGNGVTRVALQVTGGRPAASAYGQIVFPDGVMAIHDYVFADLTGERRRLNGLSLNAGLWLPAYVPDDEKGTVPAGFLRVAYPEAVFDSMPFEALDSRLHGLVGAVVVGDSLYGGFGAAGIGVSAMDSGWPSSDWLFRGFRSNGSTLVEDSCEIGFTCITGDWADSIHAMGDSSRNLAVLALAKDGDSAIWLGTARGLWRGMPGSFQVVPLGGIDSLRVTGIWVQPGGRRILVETGVRQSERTISGLWRSLDGGASFSAVSFRDSSAAPRPGFYDSLDVTLTGVAWAWGKAWAGVTRIEGSLSGALVLDSDLEITYNIPTEDDPASRAVLGIEDGFLSLPVPISGVAAIPIGLADTVVVFATYGAGLVASADRGGSWVPILNRTAVKAGLGEVRPTPSVMRYGDLPVSIGYRLDKAAKVTIEIFSYDMEKVRTIVRGAMRPADAIRSGDPRVDVWDGRDDYGALVGAGLYYIRVKSGNKESWGKVLDLVGKLP